MQFRDERSFLYIGIMVSIISILTGIPIMIQTLMGMPKLRLEDDPSVQQGTSPSGELAWEILTNITDKPHSYNTIENLRVREYLLAKLAGIQNSFEESNCSQSNPFQFGRDSVDLYIQGAATTFYESNNILLRINGKNPESLLISSHFDSALVSPGATDAGIGISSMVAVVHALSKSTCHIQLSNSIIFNFNNGEEAGLLGGSAFTKHPWFKTIKAFINLEGTGASSTLRSMAFRTNSLAMLSLVMQGSTYPHASSIVNNLMRFVRSDTDYRSYSTVGNLPGIDYAFYSYRYLYHTHLDDTAHASKASVQYMAENLLQGIRAIDNEPSFLQTITLADKYKVGPFDELPTPSFSYYDRFGVTPLIQNRSSSILQHLVVIIILVAIAMYQILSKRHTLTSSLKKTLKQSLSHFLLCCTTFSSTLLLNLVFSFIKVSVNPGVTYGYPELSFMAITALCVCCICGFESVWHLIAIKLNLSTEIENVEELYSARRQDALINPDVENDIEISNDIEIGADVESGGDVVSGDDMDDGNDIEIGNEMQSGAQSSDTTPLLVLEQGSLIESAPSLTSLHPDMMIPWLQVGLAGFWFCGLLISLFFSIAGIGALYFIYDFTLFTLLSLVATMFFGSIYTKISKVEANTEISAFKTAFILFYQNYFWIIQLLISTIVPFMYIVDIIHIVLVALPSLIGEGVNGYVVDSVFGFFIMLALINFMPLLSLTNRGHCSILFGLIFMILWTPQLFLFPYSADRPMKYSFVETWDISNASTSASSQAEIKLMSGMTPAQWMSNINCLDHELQWKMDLIVPNQFSFSIPQNKSSGQLMDVEWQKITDKNSVTISGTIVSAPYSRACSYSYNGNFTNATLLSTTPQKWTVYAGNFSYVPSNLIQVYKRLLNSQNRSIIPFGINFVGEISEMIIDCHLQTIDQSKFYQKFILNQPDWTTSGIGRNNGGAFRIRKKISFNKY